MVTRWMTNENFHYLNFAKDGTKRTKLLFLRSPAHLVKTGQGGVADNLISVVSQCVSATRPVHSWHFTRGVVATHRVEIKWMHEPHIQDFFL